MFVITPYLLDLNNYSLEIFKIVNIINYNLTYSQSYYNLSNEVGCLVKFLTEFLIFLEFI